MRHLSIVPFAVVASLVAQAACSAVPPEPCLPSVASSASSPPATSASSASIGYSGHGAGSLSPETVARYRAKPLPEQVSRSIQQVLDLRSPSAGFITDSGEDVYYTWNVTGVRQVWHVSRSRPGVPRQLTAGEDATWVVALLKQGTLVVQRDRKGEENPGLYLLSPGKGVPTLIAHKARIQTEFQGVSADGSAIYYRANDVAPDAYALYRYDIASAKSERIFAEKGLWRIADIALDGRLLLIKEVGNTARELFEFSPRTGKSMPILGVGEGKYYRASYGPDERGLIVLTHEKGDFLSLFRFTGGRLSPLIAMPGQDIESFRLDRARKTMYFEHNDRGYQRLSAFDLVSNKPKALPYPFGPELADARVHGRPGEVGAERRPAVQQIQLGGLSDNGRFLTASVDARGIAPAAVVVLDTKSARVFELSEAAAPERPAAPLETKLATYPARDGTLVPVIVRRPHRCAADPCPVIVHFHGGPEGQSRPGFSPVAQVFLDAGFVYLEPNVRGSGGYGKKWLDADNGPKRLEVITDIEDASVWARKEFASQGKVPKVGIFGGSYGGYSVLMGMTRFAGAYDAGVNVVGISNLRTFLQNTAPYRRALRISEYGDPERDGDALDKLSPTTYLDRLRAPLLTIHGVMDPRVPAGEAVQIHEGAVARGGVSELILFPDEGHGAQKRENRVLMLGHAVAFFERYLLGSK